MPNQTPRPAHALTAPRRRHDYDRPRDRTLYVAASHGASTGGPGAAERAEQLAAAEALRSIEWGRTGGVGPDDLDLAAAEDAKRIQRRLAQHRDDLGCEGYPGGMQPSDYGTLDGPAQGHTLPESRAGLVRRRWLLQIGMVIAAVVLLALACGWRP